MGTVWAFMGVRDAKVYDTAVYESDLKKRKKEEEVMLFVHVEMNS